MIHMTMETTKTETERKYCKGCKRDLPISKFGKDQSAKDKLLHQCRECHNRYQREDRQQRKEYLRTKEGQRSRLLERKYGVTLKQHKQLYTDQKGRCSNCGASIPYDEIYVSYNYETKKVRGLVGKRCFFQEIIMKGGGVI